jgi:hypothetical protein
MHRTLPAMILFGFCSGVFGDTVFNGNFETGDFSGWTQSGWFIDTTNPNSGGYDAATGCEGASCTTVGDPNSAFLFLDVTTTIGTSYTLSFFYDSGQLATSGSELLVLWGDPTAPSLSTVVDFVNVDTSGVYIEYTGTVVATSLTSQLEFLGRQDLDFYYLDDVSLTAQTATVPEPSAFLIMASVLGLLFWRSVHLTRRSVAASSQERLRDSGR